MNRKRLSTATAVMLGSIWASRVMLSTVSCHDDLSAEVGIAKTPNLEQDEIDALFSPKAAAL